MSAETIRVEVAHARPEKQVLLAVEVPPGTTLAQAIELSGIRNEFPDLEVDPARVGNFSVKARLEDVVKSKNTGT